MARITVRMPVAVAAAPALPAGFAVDAGATAAAEPVVSKAVEGGETAQPRYVAYGYAALGVGIVVGIALNALVKPGAFKPATGFDSFALLYVITQSLERLFEPVSVLVRGTARNVTQTKAQAVKSRDAALAGMHATGADTGQQAEDAAAAQARINCVRRNATVVIWGLQSAIGMVLAGWLGIHLLQGIGAASVPVEIDIIVTGLAIGGGSKALHELIKSAQVSKESKQDPDEAKGTA